ncbi:hypothetical protein RM53_14020 [Brevundimonas nasdae]|uniref:Uncharacterized protein n=1 Tax=Brevundimonas nasdae TaxID=172043 RepID=A0A0B4CV06_9CAUL|nr:hypothetical protein [Brevundimonas nasdae]KIC55950.1 hypothetical protein RM53_14020 [Brevundimonas nasdae]
MGLPSTAPVVSFHTHCLQEDSSLVPQGPGAFAAILRTEYRIHGPGNVEVMSLPPGTPLWGSAHVDSLSSAVHGHLHGDITVSDLRLGVAILIGREPAEGIDHPFEAIIRAEIDGWLGANTAFVFWPRVRSVGDAQADGFFASVIRSWASRTGRQAGFALH